MPPGRIRVSACATNLRGQPARRAIRRIGDDVIGERGVVGEKVVSAAPVAAIDQVGAEDLKPRGL